MDKLSTIQQPIQKELESLNMTIRAALQTDSDLMNSVVDYYLGVKGKQIRPLLVMLSASLCGSINESTINAAAGIELLHNASLIHDDVVDESLQRRGRKTVNGVWDNRIAVLVGDYFVSCALKCAVKTGMISIVDTLGTLGRELARGEIDQISNVEHHLIDEQAYFDVIRQKTASLFVSCMQMGALSVSAPLEETCKLMTFGEKLGLCFQIRDDIFDYYEDTSIGKPTGNDIREGKVTLPLLYALQHGNKDEAAFMSELLKKNVLSADEVNSLIMFARGNGGIQYAENVMERLRSEGYEVLSSFGDTPITASLKSILDYTIERKK